MIVSHTRFGDLNLGSLEKLQVLLTSEPQFLAGLDEKELDHVVSKHST